MRQGNFSRKTKETEISVSIRLDGAGNSSIRTPIGFMNHMLDAFARHGKFDLDVSAQGDLEVDGHHMVEDLGYVLGISLKNALGDYSGIERAGCFLQPMDESVVLCAVDLSGRAYVVFSGEFQYQFCGTLETSLIKHFFEAFARGSNSNIYVNVLAGENDHHKIEGIFKACARAMKAATRQDGSTSVPSTKGVIDL